MKRNGFKCLILLTTLLASCGEDNLEKNHLSFDSTKITSRLIDQRNRKDSVLLKCRTEDSSSILNRVNYYESYQHDKKVQAPAISQYWKRTTVYFRTDKLTFDFKVYYRNENVSYYFYQNEFFATKDNLENFFEDYWEDNSKPDTKWSVSKTRI